MNGPTKRSDGLRAHRRAHEQAIPTHTQQPATLERTHTTKQLSGFGIPVNEVEVGQAFQSRVFPHTQSPRNLLHLT